MNNLGRAETAIRSGWPPIPVLRMTQVSWPWRAQTNARRAERRTAAKSLSYLREQGWGHQIDYGANDRITPGHMVARCGPPPRAPAAADRAA